MSAKHEPPSARAREEAPESLAIVEESAEIGVQAHVTGRVSVSTRTEVIEERVEQVLGREGSEVRRVSVDRVIDAGEPLPEIRSVNGTIIVPVLEERLVIEKRLVLVEEIHVEPVTSAENVSVPVALRRQRVDVTRTKEDAAGTGREDTHEATHSDNAPIRPELQPR